MESFNISAKSLSHSLFDSFDTTFIVSYIIPIHENPPIYQSKNQ